MRARWTSHDVADAARALGFSVVSRPPLVRIGIARRDVEKLRVATERHEVKTLRDAIG
jgi:hypothetical protein